MKLCSRIIETRIRRQKLTNGGQGSKRAKWLKSEHKPTDNIRPWKANKQAIYANKRANSANKLAISLQFFLSLHLFHFLNNKLSFRIGVQAKLKHVGVSSFPSSTYFEFDSSELFPTIKGNQTVIVIPRSGGHPSANNQDWFFFFVTIALIMMRIPRYLSVSSTENWIYWEKSWQNWLSC